MSNAVELLEKLHSLGVQLSVDGDNLRYKPASIVPPDLIEAMRQQKAEIITHLSKPAMVDAKLPWHAQEIARAVNKEGISLFWSELHQEMVAFIKNDSFKDAVPCNVVAYTEKELKELFGEGKSLLSPSALKLIHEAKKVGGGHVTSYERRATDAGE